jgi:hypothetical protein
MEIREIPGWLGYKISEDGIVYTKSGKEFSLFKQQRQFNTPPYLAVILHKEGKAYRFMVHRLVALTFIGLPPFEGAIVRHLNGNSLNNHYSNLAYGTNKDDAADQKRCGTFAEGLRSGKSKFTEVQILEIRSITGVSNRAIARKFNVGHATINFIRSGKSYKNL